MQPIMILSCILSCISGVGIGCLWFPRFERFVGFCIVSGGLIIANVGLKVSVYGGRMVDDSRPSVKPIPFDGIPIGNEVPCNCPLCRDDLPSIVLLRRQKLDTQPLKDWLN